MLRLFPPPAEDSPLWDLPLPQLRTLHVLRRRGDLTMREVAGSLGVAMSTATQVADRRVVRLALSVGGQAALAELHRQRDERIAAALDRLSEPEQETVLAGLRLLEHATRESAPEGSRPHPLWDVVSEAMQSEPAGDRAGNHGNSEG
jgi:DNA-binding MarR family transcriptional regulator